MTRTGFLLDLHRCVGCGACVLACRLANGRTTAAAWRRIVAVNPSHRRGGPTYYLSLACHHCVSPACLEGCPARAYSQRPDGIVVHDATRCLGCRYCEMTCPFGTPRFDADTGVVSKCDLCASRLDQGGVPACIDACPTAALTLWRDGADDPNPTRETVPGFAPGPPAPSLRFRSPRGTIRVATFDALDEALRR